MSLGNVMQANGSLVRASSELNLLKMEECKRFRVNATIAGAKSKETDAVGDEANASARKGVDAFFQKKAAEEAKTSATWGFWSSIASGISGIASSNSTFGAISAAIKGGFGVLGAYFAMAGAGDELDLANKQFGILSGEAQADQNTLKALDANPYA